MDDLEFQDFVVGQTTYKTKLNKKFENRKKWEPPNEKKVIAFIPGTIRDVLVKKGSRVKEGDELLILEAMKMKNRVLAPLDGKIKTVSVKTDDKVSRGALLIEFE